MRQQGLGWLGAVAFGIWFALAGSVAAQGSKDGASAVVQTENAEIDYAAWTKKANASEKVISDSGSDSTELDALRADLIEWRAAFLAAQSANATRIATLRTQISALGEAPAEGVVESTEITKRRTELNEQLVKLQAPGIAADEAYQRADGLIGEINTTLRERQADELLQLWPMPINPTNWPEALRAVSAASVTVYSEFNTKWKSDAAREVLTDKLPMVLALLALAAGILWRGRMWIDQQILQLQEKASARGRRIVAFVASIGQILIPLAGVVLISVALQMTGLLGDLSAVIVATLGPMGALFFVARWLGSRAFPTGNLAMSPLGLVTERRLEGRVLATSFGILLAAQFLLRQILTQQEASEATISVLSYPILVLGGLLLVRMGQFIAQHTMQAASDAEGEAEAQSYSNRIMLLLARAAMLVGVIGPVLATVGYVSAATAMVYPAIKSLGLIAFLIILQQLVAEIYALIRHKDETQIRDALTPVLINFALILVSLPVFALIWGTQTADLTEAWAQFREGVQLGDARISPSVFLAFAAIFGLGYGATRVVQGALRTSILPRTALDQGGQNAVVSGIGYIGIFLAALVAIRSAGIDLSGLAIVAGALSVGIGFGLQTVVSNFVSGIILLIERPVSEGDWIEVGTTQGIVKSISVRSTRIQTFDRSDVIVPNSDLVSGTVTNYTRFSMAGRLIVPVGVAYGSDTRKVEKVLMEVAEAQPMVVLNPPPQIILAGFGADSVNFEVRMILRDVNFSVAVRSEVNHAIVAAFAKHDIEIPFTQQDIHLRNIDELADALRAIPKPKQRPEV